MAMVLIKRYANRKLYNTETSRYITLKGIAELIEQGTEVRVVDNETGEDITSVALSQILVDNERAQRAVPRTLLSDLIQRSGDVLYGALKRGVGDAQEGIGELQRNVRQAIRTREQEASRWRDTARAEWDELVHGAVERVFKALDLPRRSDLEALEKRLDQVLAQLGAPPSREPTRVAEPAREPRTASGAES